MRSQVHQPHAPLPNPFSHYLYLPLLVYKWWKKMHSQVHQLHAPLPNPCLKHMYTLLNKINKIPSRLYER
ncbi:hypothetical protein Hanom_Chr17g01591571 [Helianthus anomalus]